MKNMVEEKVKNVGKRVNGSIKKVKMIDEFRIFIARGNVLDLAVGVIIGGAFQKLVTSLTDHIISPILGCFTEVDFSSYSFKIGNLNLQYGAFLTDVINFVIMAFIVFLIVKFMNKILVKTKQNEKAKEPVKKGPTDIELLEEIRDLLKENISKKVKN